MLKKLYNLSSFFYLMFGILFSVSAQNNILDQQNLIAASQAGASPLFFHPKELSISTIQPSNFCHPDEFKVRGGLSNLFEKLNNGHEVIIGYLGGSITKANDQYRLQSAKFIQSQFPKSKITGINAGISGTGTDLGACRLYEQLLKYNPDLVFIEFAVNGAFAEGMEGIIRQIWRYNPRIDICMIYTITDGLGKVYTEGKIPDHIAKLDLLATHYDIPSVHLGMESGFLEKEGKLVWKGNIKEVTDRIVFSADGVHPLLAGGNLYAESLVRALLQMNVNRGIKTHWLPEPMFADNWEDAQMIDPVKIAKFDKNWTQVSSIGSISLKQFSDWFPYLLRADKPGARISFSFEGSMFGLFDIGGPEVGQLELLLDGKPLKIKQTNSENYVESLDITANNIVNRFNRFCNDRYRGQCFFVKVEQGKHTVQLIISSRKANKSQILGESQNKDINLHPEKYNRTVEYVGKILIRGKVILDDKSK